ncbi:nitrate- and nitrite sensing domain-containing protein [Sulfurimonas paralvinellae]|uniref:Nitrate/nitrite sensing protein domain-containing protein n=1 Tax=Sulfurimonas paralvinellae TaxID=317658 RepID=A0A7M1B5R2_9BACT|nr:nitrate- and nitrite sensing domain-containing protein [Sulfurimonas paralvinellae]QOP45041.1 hypothetical protein FM071_01500 [Sulfurimonas paralvinellae]
MRYFLLILLLVFNLQAKSFFSNQEQLNTSKYIENLKKLIIATQKTRGLTNSYLNGNTAAMLLVFSTREDMKSAIGNMESLPLAGDPVINTRATAISQSLIKLNRKAFKRPPNKVFSAYTEQIEQTLMLAQSVSKRFAKDLTPFSKDISSVMMEIMLPMTEQTGRLRGLGAGIAAKGEVNKGAVEDIKMLSYELQSLNKQLQEDMTQIIAKYPDQLPANITNTLASVNNDVKTYTAYAEKKLLKNPKSVDADRYFDRGTALIAKIIEVYDLSNQAIMNDAKGWI